MGDENWQACIIPASIVIISKYKKNPLFHKTAHPEFKYDHRIEKLKAIQTKYQFILAWYGTALAALGYQFVLKAKTWIDIIEFRIHVQKLLSPFISPIVQYQNEKTEK